MIVVSDTGPMGYLIEIGGIDLLRRIYGSVLIPPAVLAELSHPQTPWKIRDWMASRPGWIVVRSATSPTNVPARLGLGETEALSLALECQAAFLSDDLDARRFVRSRKMEITGTVGVLVRAHVAGYAEIRTMLVLLADASFHSTPELMERAIEAAERGRTP